MDLGRSEYPQKSGIFYTNYFERLEFLEFPITIQEISSFFSKYTLLNNEFHLISMKLTLKQRENIEH